MIKWPMAMRDGQNNHAEARNTHCENSPERIPPRKQLIFDLRSDMENIAAAGKVTPAHPRLTLDARLQPAASGGIRLLPSPEPRPPSWCLVLAVPWPLLLPAPTRACPATQCKIL